MTHETNDRRFQGSPDRLRAEKRTALLEIDRVINLSLEDAHIKSVLDVGTGTGLFAESFMAQGLKVAGIDTNSALLQEAERYVPGAELTIARAEEIPYEDDAFDLTFLGHLLHEADDPVTVLREARRVSRMRVAILEWPYEQGTQGPPLHHRLPVDKVIAMAEEAGLQHIEHIQLSHMDLYRMAVPKASNSALS